MKKKLSSPDKFYNQIASIYEKMIDFPRNLELRINAYQNIFPLKGTVADIGGGTGLDSIALAKNGHKVTMFDLSPKMVKEARKNASKYNATIKTEVNSFDSIPIKYDCKFTYVVSVGNTIAHLTTDQLRKAINRIDKLLLPDGKLFLHVLNYDLIIKSSKRINNIANRDGKVIIRFYDFEKDQLKFNILSFPVNETKNFSLVTTKHFPHKHTSLRKIIKEAGFKNFKIFGNFNLEPFDVKKSKDIFIMAAKSI